jgi:hypothetical protein
VAKLRIHGILGDLHRLLSQYSASDFIEASSYSGISRRMRDVLRFLAHEADSDGSVAPLRASHGEERVRFVGQHMRTARVNNEQGRTLSAVLRSPHIRSNRDMVMFARSIGLKLQANPKDSRERVARRLAALLERLPEEKKEEAIANLLLGRSTQTQGWIDVIKSSNQ